TPPKPPLFPYTTLFRSLSGDKNPAILRTLGAAYAENGRFTEARVTAERGLQLANAWQNSALANILEGDIARYRINTPLRTATERSEEHTSELQSRGHLV